MEYMFAGIWQALVWLWSGHAEVYSIVWISLKVVLIATGLASLMGVPLGFSIAIGRFPGRHFVISVFNTLLAMPTVVIGLMLYALLARRGPLGDLGLMFTPSAVVIGEVLLALPIIVALTIAAVHAVDPRVRETAFSLGAGPTRSALAVLAEASLAICSAVVTGFGRIIAEVGVAMMLGGNIRGYTRTMTTAIALETSKGEFELALALGVILLLIAFVVNVTLYYLQTRTA